MGHMLGGAAPETPTVVGSVRPKPPKWKARWFGPGVAGGRRVAPDGDGAPPVWVTGPGPGHPGQGNGDTFDGTESRCRSVQWPVPDPCQNAGITMNSGAHARSARLASAGAPSAPVTPLALAHSLKVVASRAQRHVPRATQGQQRPHR
jgi:hypothetical protein